MRADTGEQDQVRGTVAKTAKRLARSRQDALDQHPAHKLRRFACARFRHDRVRLLTRRGYDWTKRFPQVVEAVMRLPVSSILIESEGGGVRRERR